jgi:hypothetical protein
MGFPFLLAFRQRWKIRLSGRARGWRFDVWQQGINRAAARSVNREAGISRRSRRQHTLVFRRRNLGQARAHLTEKIHSRKEQSMETRIPGRPEDQYTAGIEAQTSKLPSVGFLAAALGAMGVSAVLKATGRDEWSLFVGQWAPTFLILGLYNKLVKQQGSDAYSRAA